MLLASFFYLFYNLYMKKDIVFVMGLPFYGKSHYIKVHFSDYKVLDIFDYQKDYPIDIYHTLSSYYQLACELCKSLKDNDHIVIEHTLVKAKRRKMFIDIIQELIGQKPRAIFLKPNFESYNKNRVSRGEKPVTKDDYYFYFDQMEIPQVEEGFESVEIVEY